MGAGGGGAGEAGEGALLSYVMWNLFTVGSIQFSNYSARASLKAKRTKDKILCK